jgi:hypothetical protein
LSESDPGYEKTDALLRRIGVKNYSTAVGHIGHRPIKQAARQTAMKRKAKRQKEGGSVGGRVPVLPSALLNVSLASSHYRRSRV